MVKLIASLAALVVMATFAGFNIGEGASCKVNLIFHTFADVPVFLTIIISFAIGVIVGIISMAITGAKKRALRKDFASRDFSAINKGAAGAFNTGRKKSFFERRGDESNNANGTSGAAANARDGAKPNDNPTNEQPIEKNDTGSTTFSKAKSESANAPFPNADNRTSESTGATGAKNKD